MICLSIYLSQGDYIAIAILAKLYYIGSPKTPKNILKSNEYGKKCFEYLIELTKKVKDDMFILTLLGYFYQYKIGINILSSIIIIIVIIIICIILIVKNYYHLHQVAPIVYVTACLLFIHYFDFL